MLPEDVNVILFYHSFSIPPVIAVIIVWIPVGVAVGVAIWVAIWIVVIWIRVLIIGFPLIAIIGERIVPRAIHTVGIIRGRVSAAKNPTGRKPDLSLIIRLC